MTVEFRDELDVLVRKRQVAIRAAPRVEPTKGSLKTILGGFLLDGPASLSCSSPEVGEAKKVKR